MYGSDNLKYYVGRKIIAYMSYNEEREGINTICYVYPRFYLDDNNRWQLISTSDFLEYGSIIVHLSDRQDVGKFVEEKGRLVLVKINAKDGENHLFPQDRNGKSAYHMLYNSRFGKDGSQIWIESFMTERDNFCQLIHTSMTFDGFLNKKAIQYNGVLYTSDILVYCDGNYYGPFAYEKKDGGFLGLKSKNEAGLYNHICQFDADSISDEKNDILDHVNREFCSIIHKNYIKTLEVGAQKIDWLSDKELIELFIDTLNKCGYPRQQVKEFSNFLQCDGKFITKDRQERLMNNIENLVSAKEFARSALKFVWEDEELKDQLLSKTPDNEDYVKDNSYYKRMKTELDDLSLKMEEVLQSNKVLQNDKKQLEDDNRQLKEQLNNYVPTDDNSELIQKLERLENENKEFLELNQRIENLRETERELTAKKESLEAQKENLEAQCSSYQRKFDNLEKEIAASVSNLKEEAKIVARQLDTDFLNKVLAMAANGTQKKENVFDDTLLINDISGEEIIDRVQSYLAEAGRNVSRNEVVNYLTCISQGFITTFAGEPGTGKTSLCNLLAKSLGLVRNDDNNRFAEISVERGWTSVKDFIGYYNPLTGKVEQSNVEAFEALHCLDGERDENKLYAPFIMLLDEANFSPLEHYWANFLRLCDEKSVSKRRLNLGGEVNFYVPPHLRFLATVNFDHTTEELSPRFLDRSWIVTLNPSGNISEVSFDLPELDSVVSYRSLIEAFGNEKYEEENSSFSLNLIKWKKVMAVFKECHLPIMPRNRLMVERYMKTAGRFMECSGDNIYSLTDYAVSQKILPTINGSGENYKRLMERLSNEVEELPIAKEHLERIKRVAAQNMGFYQFFAK